MENHVSSANYSRVLETIQTNNRFYSIPRISWAAFPCATSSDSCSPIVHEISRTRQLETAFWRAT